MTKSLEITTKQFPTYNTKVDPYNTSQSFLIGGSRNVLISNLEKFSSRKGFTLQSPTGTSGSTVPGSTDWDNSTGCSISLRGLETELRLEAFINSNWETLMDSLTSVNFIFDPYWDDTEKIDRLLWCDGSVNVYDWSGAVATLASITATVVTKQGTDTFGVQRFLTTGTRAIRIKDDNGTWHRTGYTGGEGTTILTGLTVDLTAFPFTGGNLIVQEVITRSNYIASTFYVDFLRVIDNQAWVGSRKSNDLYFSKNSDIASFSYSTPRAVGEGGLLTLDGPGRGVGDLRGDVIAFAGRGFIYKSQFNQITVGSSLAETVKVIRLKTTGLQSAQHQNLIENVGNGLVWIGYDNVMYELLDATLAYNPNLYAASDPVKPDFDSLDFGNTSGNWGHLKFFKTRIHVSVPSASVCYIREYRITDSGQKEWFWQPPQTLPIKRWAVIDNDLHGHSNSASETYKMFDGLRDNDGPINCVVELGRWNGGHMQSLKRITEIFHQGAGSANTKIAMTYKFDKDGGVQQNIYKTIDLSLTDLIYDATQDPSLGNLSLGDLSLSGDIISSLTLPKFRIIHEFEPMQLFDYGVRFETNDFDQQWEIMVHGNDASLSTDIPTSIHI